VNSPTASPHAAVQLVRRPLSAIPGWDEDDAEAAFPVFQRSAREILGAGSAFSREVCFAGSRESWRDVCEAALAGTSPRQFFENWFMAFEVRDRTHSQGLFTGYYEPEARGSRIPNQRFSVPLYRTPADLVAFSPEEQRLTGLVYGRRLNGKPQPYFSRDEIENGALNGSGLELVWLASPADAYFIHVQGSARIRFDDDSFMRLSFAAKSGRPYTSIGGLLAERGVIARDDMSMQAIRSWMASHGEEARQLMRENQSFIFFREVDLPDPDLGAFGAQHVQLTPRRSIAVDRTIWAYGTPVWIDCEVPPHAAQPDGNFRSLMIAQDTGSAILGGARADIYWGFGDAAGAVAGKTKGTGRMTVLLPRPVAAELGLAE
jgi:membrane-bound lytic murein transglycosylase A